MTEIFLKTPECNCPADDSGKHLAITEGNTTVWRCKHVKVLTKTTKSVWV